MEAGTLPSELEKEDFFEFLELMQAKPREDRVMSSGEAHRRMRGG